MLNDILHVEGTGQKNGFVQEDPVINRKKRSGNETQDRKLTSLVGQNSVATLSLTSNLLMSHQTAKLGAHH